MLRSVLSKIIARFLAQDFEIRSAEAAEMYLPDTSLDMVLDRIQPETIEFGSVNICVCTPAYAYACLQTAFAHHTEVYTRIYTGMHSLAQPGQSPDCVHLLTGTLLAYVLSCVVHNGPAFWLINQIHEFS